MDLKTIDSALEATLDDMRLSRSERKALDQLFSDGTDDRDLDVIRGRAFEIAQQHLRDEKDHQVVEWLERVVKAVENARIPAEQSPRVEAWFSPGTQCRDRLVGLMRGARKSLDGCVFAVTDNTLSRTILARSRPETALFRNFVVRLRVSMCDVRGVRLRGNPCLPRTYRKIARFHLGNHAVRIQSFWTGTS